MNQASTNDITSERVVYPNVDGKKIVAYIDSRGGNERAPIIVLTPKYGESKKNGLQLAYYLAANGFRVLRFDFTCHFGESEGEMLRFTLGEAVDNIIATLDYVERTFGVESVTLLASSLSALAAVKAAARDSRVDHLVAIVGVVDLTYTLVKVYQDDLVGGYLTGRRFGVLDILGHEVQMDDFFAEATRGEFHRLDLVARDIAQIQAPISWFPARKDTWVRLEDVEALARVNPRMTLFPLEGAMHEVRENQEASEKATRLVVEACRARAPGLGAEPFTLETPSRRTLLKQNRVERERLRAARPIAATEDEFWSQYLEKYRVMEKMDDFQQYLDLVGGLIGIPGPGETILDAGCGNGLFGAWLIRALLREGAAPPRQPPLYVGLELTRPGLCDASARHAELAQRMSAQQAGSESALDLIYTRGDLEVFGEEDAEHGRTPRFAEASFDKVLCSLLLSYLEDPSRLLARLHRVLKPGGRIVVSSMKPFCDLSAIYRDFIEQKAAKADVESARDLLRAAGALKVKEEQGYYVFYGAEELAALLERAGFVRVRFVGSLGDQAKVAVGFK